MIYEEYLKKLYWEGFRLHKIGDLFVKAWPTIQWREIRDRQDRCWLGPAPTSASCHRVDHVILQPDKDHGLDPVPRVSDMRVIKLQEGDVILSTSTREELRPIYVQDLGGREVFASHGSRSVIRSRTDADYKLDPVLLAHMLARPTLTQVFRSEMSATTVWNSHNLWKVAQDLMVPVLTDEQQQKLADLIKNTGKLLANKRRAIVLHEELCDAVLHEFLTKGKVNPPEPRPSPALPREMKVWSVIGYYPDNDQAYNGEHRGFTARMAAIDAMEQAEDNGTWLYVVDVLEGSPKAHSLGDKVITDIDDLQMFTIRYTHTECSATWEEVCECACNGECSVCGAKDIQPVMWKDVDDEWSDTQEAQWDAILEVIRVAAVARQPPGQTT